ncbi:probable calcium-binding protein CML48 [Pyrus x bretschneideri]|uniref:probable calcium-binding protein CML48 n=1 Tax=Pyrus x bretschneideri TaxID=225117 RepID=UPI00202FC22F|nr:probable calcium-binding protein CML48 [Pyrus x bretschneideri]
MPFLGVRDSECCLTSYLSEENVLRFYKIDPMFSLLQTVTLNYGLNLKLQSIFERYDKDRSGKIDSMELRDALYGLGLAMPPSVLQLLISKYDDGSGRRIELNFDSFVECGMIVRVSKLRG